MIRGLERRLTAVLMLFLMGVYVGFCSWSFFASSRSMERESDLLLHRITEPVPPGQEPPEMPGKISLPYLTMVLDSDGNILNVQQGQFDFSEGKLSALAKEALMAGRESGYLKSEDLRFVRMPTEEGWRVLLADDSFRSGERERQVRSNVILGLVLLPVFFLFSRCISAFVARPVRRAWERQVQFVADASHELKTPLTVILSNTDMILSDCREEDEALRRRAGFVREEAGRMRGLVMELLSLARSDAAPARKEALTALDLSAAAETAALSFEAVAYENGLSLATEVEDGVNIRGQEQELGRLLDILLDNAVKYSLPGGEIRLTVSAEKSRYALLTVSNPGEPIEKEQLRRLFDRFYRMDEARSLKPGYGLGLSLARQIVDRWGGKIWAEHQSGVTRFCVRLPKP